jgi:PAS domain S-box-containing protein
MKSGRSLPWRDVEQDDQHLNLALEAAGIATFDLELDTGALWRSPQHDVLFGYECNQEDWTTDTFFEHVYEGDRERVKEEFAEAKKREEISKLRFRIRTPQNELRWLEARGRMIPDNNGQPHRFGGILMDVSDRIRIDQDMWKYKRQIQRSEELAQLGFWQYYQGQDELVWSKQVFQMFGLEPQEDVDYYAFMQMVHPEDRDRLMEAQQTAIRNHTAMSVEYRLIKPDGTVGHFREMGEMYQEAESEDVIFGGVIQEITRERKYKQELEASELKFRQLFQNAPISIVLVDRNGNIQLVNKAFKDTFEYSDEELGGANLDQLLVPNERQKEALDFTLETLSGKSIQTESVRMNRSGEEVPVLMAGVPVKFNDRVSLIYGMYVDITKRKRLENEVKELLQREQQARRHAELELTRIQEMFDQAPSAISLVAGEDHRFVYANDQYQKMVDKRVTIGQPIGEAVPELAAQGFVTILNEVRETAESVQGSEVGVMLKKPGSDELEERLFNYLYKPLMNANGEIDAIFIEVIDVTEEARAKRQIKRSLEEKTVLLQEIHHRVKNNLALISSLLELQADESSDEKIIKSLKEARSRIFSISKIHEVLYQDKDLAHVSFSEYIREIMNAMENMIDSKHSHIGYTLDLDEVHLSINKAIPAGLLLNELVSNAFEHAFEGREEGMVWISLKEDADGIIMQVKDDGIGLPENFDDEQGKSLGWTLVETLNSQLHGRLDISGSPAGTTVCIRFEQDSLDNSDSLLMGTK